MRVQQLVRRPGCVPPAAVKPHHRDDDREEIDSYTRRNLEDELRDPKNFVEYFLPRPLRLTFLAAAAFSCLVAVLVGAVGGSNENLIVNATGCLLFAGLFIWDQQQAQVRVQQRATLRQAQIDFGDREVYYNKEGERMSKLKEVDDDWILRRLERWGKRDGMPFVGPQKAAMLQSLIREHKPRCIVEVGTMCGYSALKMAQALPPGSRIITIEKEWTWVLSAKRFAWQSSQGARNDELARQGLKRIGDRIEVRWGTAEKRLQNLRLADDERVDMLFLDGTPKETLAYLEAVEDQLADKAVIVADNAGIFKDGGMKSYLDRVRSDPRFQSEFLEAHLEWRPEVADGMEVSIFSRQPASIATTRVP